VRYDRWLTHRQREAQRDAIARAGGVCNSLRDAGKRRPITGEERTRKAAVNALAHKFGFPPPYPDLDAYPRADESGPRSS